MVMKQKRVSRMISLFMIMILAFTMLQGCGGGKVATAEELLAEMKEFSTPDGSATIYLNKEWITEDAGSDTFLTAGSKDGREAVLMMQFPKGGIFPVESMDDLKELVETSYGMTDYQEAEAFEVPGMTNISVGNCKMSSDGTTAQVYLLSGETEYAYYSIGFVATKISDKNRAAFKASLSKFTEVVPEVENNSTAEVTDTIRWFNASYAVLTDLNGWDYNLFGGLPANDDSMAIEKELLNSWWGVTDRQSADENLNWILEEGHRTGFAEDMKLLEEAGLGEVAEADRGEFLLANFDIDAESVDGYVNSYSMYEQFGENAIAGWDYCRALSLMGYYYLAGYYTEEEALDKSLEIAMIAQPLFESWDDLMDSYLRGYEYWAEESPDERRGVYEDIKTRDDSPYTIDYKMTLQKTW